MIFSSKATPRWPATLARLVCTRVALWVGIASLGLVASCGGGTSQFDPFIPKRLLVFGDDYSALTQNNRNYSVNAIDVNGNINCIGQPIWVQQLASVYGFSFAECNPNADFQPAGRMLAFAGAKVADVGAQVEAQVAAGGFRDKDLATVLAGANDIIELYESYPSLSQDILLAEARARGQRLARVVNRLVDLGAKVIIADLPDLGLSPYAVSRRTVGQTFDPVDFISRLTVAFNEQLGVNVVLDGRFVGLVQTQLRFQAIARSPGSFGLLNITAGICTVAPPNCTSSTLLPDATVNTYLWSDDRRLAPGGHAQLASLAVDRARRNPLAALCASGFPPRAAVGQAPSSPRSNKRTVVLFGAAG